MLTAQQYLGTLSLLGLIWTKQTRIGAFRGDTHASQLAELYRYLTPTVEA